MGFLNFFSNFDIIMKTSDHEKSEMKKQRHWSGALLTLLLPILLAVYAFFLVWIALKTPPIQNFSVRSAWDAVITSNITFGPGVIDTDFGIIQSAYVPSKLDISSVCTSSGGFAFLAPDGSRQLASKRTQGNFVSPPGCPMNDLQTLGATSTPASGHSMLVRLSKKCSSSDALKNWPYGTSVSSLLKSTALSPFLYIGLENTSHSMGSKVKPLTLNMGLMESALCTGANAWAADSQDFQGDKTSRVNYQQTYIPAVELEVQMSEVIDIAGISTVSTVLSQVHSSPSFVSSFSSPIDMKNDAMACSQGRHMSFSCRTADGSCINEPFFSDVSNAVFPGISNVLEACNFICSTAWNTMYGTEKGGFTVNLAGAKTGTPPPSFNTDVRGISKESSTPHASLDSSASSRDTLSWTIAGLRGESFSTSDRNQYYGYNRYLQALTKGIGSAACSLVNSAITKISKWDNCSMYPNRELWKIPPRMCYSGPYSDEMSYLSEIDINEVSACSWRQANDPTFGDAPTGPLSKYSKSNQGCSYSFEPYSDPASIKCGLTISIPSTVYVQEDASRNEYSVHTQIPANLASGRTLCAHPSFSPLAPLRNFDKNWLKWFAENGTDFSAAWDFLSKFPAGSGELGDLDTCVDAFLPQANFALSVFKVEAWINTESVALRCAQNFTKAREGVGKIDAIYGLEGSLGVGADALSTRPLFSQGHVDVAGYVAQFGYDSRPRCAALGRWYCAPLYGVRFQGWDLYDPQPLLLLLIKVSNSVAVTTFSPFPINVLGIISNVLSIWGSVFLVVVVIKFYIIPIFQAFIIAAWCFGCCRFTCFCCAAAKYKLKRRANKVSDFLGVMEALMIQKDVNEHLKDLEEKQKVTRNPLSASKGIENEVRTSFSSSQPPVTQDPNLSGSGNFLEVAEKVYNSDELPPDWSWAYNESNELVFRSPQSEVTMVDPRSSFTLFSEELRKAEVRGIDLRKYYSKELASS